MKPNEYRCARCGGVFEKAQSNAEAEAEWRRDFPVEAAVDLDRALICDDCYKAFTEWLGRQGPARPPA